MPSQNKFPKLYPDRPGSLLEAAINVNISMLINRAHLAINHLQYEAARTLLIEAINLASELPEPEIPQARCCFWQGVIVDRTEREDLAPQLFVAAIPCLYHSREGDRLLPYIQKYWSQVLDWMHSSSQEKKAKSETLQQWRNALREVQDRMNSEHTSIAETSTNSPAYRRHSLPSPRKASVDSEDDETSLHRLVGEYKDYTTHVFHHEGKAGSKVRPKAMPKAMPGFTVPHSLPRDGLMKAIPLGSLQGSSLTQIDSSRNTEDGPSMLPCPKLGSMHDTRGEGTSQPRTIKRSSSMRMGLMKRLSTKLSTPINTQKQEPSSEPETPSPLRKASLPGDDMAPEKDTDETF